VSVDLLKKQIKTGEFAGLYVLYGEEDYLKSFYCKKITDKAVTGFENFNLQRFDGAPDMARLAAAGGNLPLMSPKKCVVLRDTDPQSLRANEWKELQGIIKSLPPECILIFYFDAVKPNPKKDARFKSLLTTAQKLGLAVEISAPTRRDTLQFIVKRAKANGCEIDADTAGYLADTCGGGLNNLGNECDKVCALADGGPVTKEQIDALAVRPLTRSIYDLAREVVAGRLDAGLRIIDELFYKKEEPVVILSALSGAFCDLYRAKAALLSGVADTRVIADFNYRGREFRVRNAMRDCRSADIGFLSECLRLLMAADGRIKSTPTDKRTVLEQLMVEIALAGRKQERAR
jgi:DNA polymerase III subunit delta